MMIREEKALVSDVNGEKSTYISMPELINIDMMHNII